MLAWLALVLPLWLLFVFCTYREPIMHDGWGHFFWHQTHELSPGGLYEFFKGSYVHNNPRLGQTFTLIQHTPGVLHPIVTPLVELALFYLLTVLVLGRTPSLRSSSDALVFATIVAMVFACAPTLGSMLFYRPYTGNYVFGLVVNLAWLAPYRLHLADPKRWQWGVWSWPLFAILGVASGLCNEHTGPALVLAGIVALAVYWHRGERVVPWAWIGLAGMIAGGALLYFAPGQDIRYAGLATQQSILERIVERGVAGSGRVVGMYALSCVPLLLWVALGIAARVRHAAPRQPRTATLVQLALLGLAVAIVLTLLASPKLGYRLYFAPLCLTCAACAGWVLVSLGAHERRVAAALAGIVLVYVGVRLVRAYERRGDEFADRLRAIETAPKGTVVHVMPYSQKAPRYVLTDDFRSEKIRAVVASRYQLAGIELVPSSAPPTSSAPVPLQQAPSPAVENR